MGSLQLNVVSEGEGKPIVLLHGLTASQKYGAMGSNQIPKSGFRLVTYDARGHGKSEAPKDGSYSYSLLVDDLVDVLDQLNIDQAVIGGTSMGSHTSLLFALRYPERVAGLLLTTPAYLPGDHDNPVERDRWNRLSFALRDGGIEEFIQAEEWERCDPRWRDVVMTATRQRLQTHQDLVSVADAIDGITTSSVFSDLAELATIDLPVTIIASSDHADPWHQLAVADAWQQAIPGSKLLIESEGSAPIAWQGRQISDAAIDLWTTNPPA